jgi:predicted CXXCH cytochrome family protein
MMYFRNVVTILAGFMAAILVLAGSGALESNTTLAQTRLPDLPCRECHADKQEDLVLPSGQILSTDLSLEALNASVHSFRNSPPVYCTDCHTNKDYRYPHPITPAQTLREYTAWVSQSCDNCHYPHRPFHPEDQGSLNVLPTCAECHGSHEIGPIEQLMDSMPANCVQCHTDQSEAWAATFIAPRPGFGEGAEGYIGSDRCGGCHEDLYREWQGTLHARMVQDVRLAPEAVLGNFQQRNPARSFDLAVVDYVIGNRWKQLYMTHEAESGAFHLLPAQWNIATAEWVPYHPDDWQERDWRRECGSCHVTGLETENWTFEEFGIGCESCHGPGRSHARDPLAVKIFVAVDDQVCGACHSRGESPEGHPFAATYRPGEDLKAHFTFATDASLFWPDGSARANNMQYMDWHLVENSKERSGKVDCVTCHTVHTSGEIPGQLSVPVNELCVSCHGDKQALMLHTPYHRVPSVNFEFTCADCHMPLMATSAVSFDIRNHSFHQPTLETSLAFGPEEMPNSCMLCHQNMSASRAFETVSYAAAVMRSSPASVFGPGPTPTSPPPPTPLPSVGQPAQEVQTPANTWVRYAFLSLLGLSVLGVIYAFIWIIRSREPNNVQATE